MQTSSIYKCNFLSPKCADTPPPPFSMLLTCTKGISNNFYYLSPNVTSFITFHQLSSTFYYFSPAFYQLSTISYSNNATSKSIYGKN